MKSSRIKLAEVNPYLICALCNGYLVNATTTVECLHTFCKSCIYRFLESNDRKTCPICETLMNKSKPSLSLRPDPVLQSVVYSLVPGLYTDEKERKNGFYALPEKHPREVYSVRLEYLLGDRSSNRQIPASTFKCPASVTIADIESIIRAKYNLADFHLIEFYYSPSSDCVKKFFSIDEVFGICSDLQESEDSLKLFYKIFVVKAKDENSKSDNSQEELVSSTSTEPGKKTPTDELRMTESDDEIFIPDSSSSAREHNRDTPAVTTDCKVARSNRHKSDHSILAILEKPSSCTPCDVTSSTPEPMTLPLPVDDTASSPKKRKRSSPFQSPEKHLTLSRKIKVAAEETKTHRVEKVKRKSTLEVMTSSLKNPPPCKSSALLRPAFFSKTPAADSSTSPGTAEPSPRLDAFKIMDRLPDSIMQTLANA